LKVKKTSNRNAGIGKITIARIISRTNGTPRLPSVKLLMFFIITALSKPKPHSICQKNGKYK
jgi:hypothetical protein